MASRLYNEPSFTSQVGQDSWVCGEAFNGMTNGTFVDIGAHDGIQISNTYVLESTYKWSGLCIEANPETFQRLKQNRRATLLNLCLDQEQGVVEFALRGLRGGIVDRGLDNEHSGECEIRQIQTTTLGRVMEDWRMPAVVDYLSIDVEGAEERILGGFDFDKYQFRCITIERPTDLLRKLFEKHGYVLVREVPALDCFYIHRIFVPEYKKNLRSFYREKRRSGRG